MARGGGPLRKESRENFLRSRGKKQLLEDRQTIDDAKQQEERIG